MAVRTTFTRLADAQPYASISIVVLITPDESLMMLACHFVASEAAIPIRHCV